MNKLEEPNFPVEEEVIFEDSPTVALRCCQCEEELTLEESEDWYENTPRCCNGYMCGCMGMPIDPPYCNKCIEEGQRLMREEAETQ